MCGRYSLGDPTDLEGLDELGGLLEWSPRYNLAPTQSAPVVRVAQAGLELTVLRWGLVPSWSKDRAIGNKLINARAETVADKPSFRQAFARRRCLVPASGFYEWQAASKPGAKKQPYFIHATSGHNLGLAGLWERWKDEQGAALETFAIVTTEANELMTQIHGRMPVVLPPSAYRTWLAPTTPAAQLQALLVPCPSELLAAHAVSTIVNSPSHDSPACIAPLPPS